MKNSREIIAQCIGAQPEEIFFTSGGTESNNWAIKGIAFSDPVKHAFITSVIEHHAILRPCADIERMGHPVSYLPVDYTGTVNIETLAENINSDTRLVSVMTANNEIGSVQDIPALAAIAHSCGAIFHTDAVQAVGHPLAEYQKIVLDAINIGRMGMSKKPDAEIQKAIQQFAVKYGLFGLMTALPTTPNFMEYEAVYLPKNHFIKEETMSTEKYLALFFPFDKLDVIKRGIESMWNIQNNRVMMALALTMTDKPMAVNMSFQREYAERYEWMKQQFIDWAFTYINSFLYYEDYDTLNDETRQMMQQSMAAFGGIAPTYHIALLDKPTIVWDFHSLMLGVQMMFSFMLTDSENPIKLCRHCTKAFVASRPSAVFCSPQCKNKHNVYKSRAKKNKDGDENA